MEKIRDSIGSIRNLDSLYQNRTNPNGLPYHLYVPAALQPGTKYPLVIFLHGATDLTIDTHKGFPKESGRCRRCNRNIRIFCLFPDSARIAMPGCMMITARW